MEKIQEKLKRPFSRLRARAAAALPGALLLLGPATSGGEPGPPRAASPDTDAPPAPPRPAPPSPKASLDPLREGEAALARGWYVWAFRACRRAVREGGTEAYRTAALLCEGRAALGLRWPQHAAHSAHQVLARRDATAAHLLLGDALRVQGDCRGARPQYLIVLEREPRQREALAGLRACAGEWPPPPPPDVGPHLLS